MIANKIREALKSYFENVDQETFKNDLKKAGFPIFEVVSSGKTSIKGDYDRANKYTFAETTTSQEFYLGDDSVA